MAMLENDDDVTIHDFAIRSIESGALIGTQPVLGVTALDLWGAGEYGSVLFWIEGGH